MSDIMIEIAEGLQAVLWKYKDLINIENEDECFELAYGLTQYAASYSFRKGNKHEHK